MVGGEVLVEQAEILRAGHTALGTTYICCSFTVARATMPLYCFPLEIL